MLFTSWGFALLVLALIPVYYLVPKRLQPVILLASNLIFYAFAGWGALLLLLFTGLSAYGFSRGIGALWERQRETLALHKPDWERDRKKAYKAGMEKKRRALLVLCLLLHFGLLFAMKYGAGLLGLANRLFGTEWDGTRLVMTMGISFYTFSTMGYVIDVTRGTVAAEKNPLRVLLFTSFFPILVQGPISRFETLGKQLYAPHAFERGNLEKGLLRVLWGYWKKLLLADRLLVAVRQLIRYPEAYNGAFVLLGMLLYGAALYADFTGGIDIAIGIGRMLDISIDENFRRPYFSKSIGEYWRRWHITLGAWLKEYVYYPISVCGPMRRLTKAARGLGDGFARRLPVYLATLAVWTVTGMWHGSSWNFLVWGWANGVILLCSAELEPLYARFHRHFPALQKSVCYRAFMVIRTFLLMSTLRLFDCYATVPETLRAFGSLFTVWNLPLLWRGGIASLGLGVGDWMVAALSAVVVFAVSLKGRRQSMSDAVLRASLSVRLAVYGTLLLTMLVFGYYGFGFDVGQFIYNRF